MGLNTSKPNHKVTKVTPLQRKEDPIDVDDLSAPWKVNVKRPAWEGQLPPLRETLYARASAVPRPNPLDISVEYADTGSIIQRHPPRRLQKLQPEVLPTISSAERIIEKREDASLGSVGHINVTARHEINRNELRSVMRQHQQNVQMRERNRKRQEMNHLQTQAGLRRRVRGEEEIDEHKMREIRGKETRENALKDKEDEDFLCVGRDEALHMNPRNAWPWGIHELCSAPRRRKKKNNTLEMWFNEQDIQRVLYSDSSSSDSLEGWIPGGRKGPSTLIRTRAEKIPTFDEFYDCEF